MTDPVPPRPPLPPTYAGQPPYPDQAQAPYPGQGTYPGQATYPGQPPYPGQAQAPYPGQPQFAAPPGRPAYAPVPPPPGARRSSTLGIVALVAGIVAFLVPTIVISLAGFRIGLGAGRELAARALTADFDWSILTPVRGWVLLGELSFWVGTAIGLWAIIQGVIAIVTARGRGASVAATVVAVVAPIVFFVALNVFLGLGLAAGTSVGG